MSYPVYGYNGADLGFIAWVPFLSIFSILASLFLIMVYAEFWANEYFPEREEWSGETSGPTKRAGVTLDLLGQSKSQREIGATGGEAATARARTEGETASTSGTASTDE